MGGFLTLGYCLRTIGYCFPIVFLTEENKVIGWRDSPEIRKCGFWCKLPLLYHFCGAPTQMMKISNFRIYSFTNNLLPSGLYNLVFMKRPNWQSPIGYFIIPTIYYNIYKLLYGPNFSWSLMGFARASLILVIRSSLGLCNKFCGLSS